jgi:hypothetical protein
MARSYFRTMALFWLIFGLITTFSSGLMRLFMTQQGIDASTPFSDQVWLHDGLDILAVSVLLVTLSTVPVTKTTLRAAETVALIPVTAIVYTWLTTPFWSSLFLVPAVASLAFAVWGVMLERRLGAESS